MGAGDGDEKDPFEGLTLDEDFIRAATLKEPSARSKMLAERWRESPPEAQPLRAASPPRTLPSTPPPRPHRRRTLVRWVAGLVAALLVAGLAVAAFAPGRVDALLGRRPAGDAPAADGVDPDDPFAGTPAEGYAVGAEGIVVPRARAAAGWTEASVAMLLAQAKGYLVLSRIDPRVVSQGAVEPVLTQLDPDGIRGEAAAALRDPAGENDPASWLTRFDPATTEPASPEVRVRGTVSFREVSATELRVSTDHLFVHAVRRRGEPRTVRRVVVRAITDFSFYRDKETEPGTVWTSTAWYSAAGVDCGPAGAFLRPAFGADPGAGGPARDPYTQPAVDTGVAAPGCEAVGQP